MPSSRAPALGAEGWFTLPGDGADDAALIGHRCVRCGTWAFPCPPLGCPNPGCDADELEARPLPRRGRLWSYTDARYPPPPPYIVPDTGHEPFCIAAVEIPEARIVVLGQVVAGVSVDDLRVGDEMEVTVDALFTDDDGEHLVWKWRPVGFGPEADS